MSSAAEAADSAAYLDELTGARQTWIRQCRRALAPDGGTADWAPLTDDNGAWARALRTGRELPDPHDELPLRPEIADVNAAHAIRALARHLAGRDPVEPAAAVAPLLRHCDTAHLVSIGSGSFEPLRWLVNAAWTPHRDRLRAVVDHLAETDHRAAPYVALLACHLTDTLPAASTPATVRVLYDRAGPAPTADTEPQPGATGRLTLRVLPGGPPGLHPDPARMAFFTSADDRFATSAANAWASADLSAAVPAVCVVWNLTVDGRNPAPANDVDGGSLGAAYAIALDELHGVNRRDQRWTRHVPFLSELDFRRRLTNPYAAATGTVVDTTGTLGPVSGLDHKLEAARRAGISLVITAPGTPHNAGQPRLATVTTTRQAIEQAHTHQNRSFRSTVTRVVAMTVIVALLAGTAIHLGQLGQRLAQQAATQERLAASDRLLNEAVPMLANRPREALQLMEAAATLDPSSDAVRAALVESLATTRYAGTIDDPSGGVQAVAISKDGQTAASGTATTEGAGRLSLWGFGPTAPVAPAGGGDTPAPIRVLTFAPDGQTLYSGEAGGAVTVWDVTDRSHPERRQTLHPHTNDVQEITVAPGGKVVATASSDGAVGLFRRSDSGELRLTKTLPKEESGVFCAAFSPDGSLLLTGDGTGYVIGWAITDLERPVQALRLKAHDDLVRSITVGAGGRFVASASFDATINIWDLQKVGKPTLRETLDARGKVFQAAFAPDGHTLVSVGYNRAALLWEVPDRGVVRPLATLAGHDGYVRAVAFMPNSRRLITGSLDKTMIIWNVNPMGEPTKIKTLPDRKKLPLRALAFSPDQQTLAAAGGGGTIKLYNVHDPAQPVLDRRTLRGSTAVISDIAYSPDGRRLASSDWAGVVRLWDLTRPDADPLAIQLLTGKTAQLYAVAFDPTGTRLAVGSEPGTIALLDLTDTAQLRLVARWKGHDLAVQSVSWDPVDPRRLATGSVDKTVKIWDVTDTTHATPLATLKGHDEAVLTAGYSADGSYLTSGSSDATTALWVKPEDKTRVMTRISGHTLAVRTQTFTATNLLITGSEDGTTSVFALTDPNRPVLLGTTRINRPVGRPSVGQAVLDIAQAGTTLATSTRAGTLTLYTMRPVDRILSNPHRMACAVTQTGLPPQTWAKLLPDLPYEDSCPA